MRRWPSTYEIEAAVLAACAPGDRYPVFDNRIARRIARRSGTRFKRMSYDHGWWRRRQRGSVFKAEGA